MALTTTLLWGVLPIMLKQVLQVMDPYTVTWYRLLSAGLVLFCWLAAKRRLPSIMALSGRNRGLLVVAILGLAFNYVLYLMALNRLSAGTMQLIIQTAPVMLMLGSMLVFRERFGLGQVLGLLILIAGLGAIGGSAGLSRWRAFSGWWRGLAGAGALAWCSGR